MLILQPANVNGTGMKTVAAPSDIVKSVYRKVSSHVSVLYHRFACAVCCENSIEITKVSGEGQVTGHRLGHGSLRT
jgi:hypothetical protein